MCQCCHHPDRRLLIITIVIIPPHSSDPEIVRLEKPAQSMPLSVEQMRAAPISSSDNSSLVDLLTNEAICKTFSSQISQPLVPYVDPVEIVKCDSTGGVFYSSTHHFGFTIPEGAIPEGDSISIEVGVTLTGRFDFPQGCKPVSPIVKLCVQEQPNYKFIKPVEVVLPHYLDFTSEEDNSELQIGFWKAGHTLDDNEEYTFERMDLSSTHFKHEYGVLRTNHFCFLCIAEESGVTREATAVATFYLVGYKKLLNPTEWNVYFCVAYFLATCVEVCYVTHVVMLLHRHLCCKIVVHADSQETVSCV